MSKERCPKRGDWQSRVSINRIDAGFRAPGIGSIHLLTAKGAKGAKARRNEQEQIHEAQLQLSGHRLGFVVKWNVPRIKDSIQRMVNGL